MRRIVREGMGGNSMRVLILLCIVVFAAGAGAAYWQYSRFSQLQTEVRAAEEQLQQSRSIAQRLEEAQNQFEMLRQKIQHLEMSVSERAYIPTLLKQLENGARARRLKVLSVRPSKESPQPKTEQQEEGDKKETQKKPPEPYEKQTIEVAVQGQFWDVMHFIDDLTRFPKILAVERVQMRPRPRKEATDPFHIEAQFTFTAFIFREAEGGARS